jgi:hypothetical protein
MPKRDRYADIALGLGVGLGIALLFLVWAVPGFSDPTNTEISQQHADKTKGGDGTPVQPPGFWQTYTTPSDTYAQWIAALSTLLSVGVSIWAVKLVRNTLVLNRDATKAAQDAVKVTTEIGHAQVRAYVSGVNGSFGIEDSWFHCWINVKNYGQSPAFKIKLRAAVAGWAVFSEDVGSPAWRNSTPSENICGPIMAGGEGSIFLTWNHTSFEGDALAVLMTGAGMILIDCVLDYEDVFGQKQTSHFAASYDSEAPTDPAFQGFRRSGGLTASNRDKN